MSVTYPRGFRAAGISAGIKQSGAKDLALVVADDPSSVVSAAVFTSNRIFAAPVAWSRKVDEAGGVAIVLNSGGANACTGPEGYNDSVETARVAGEAIGLEPTAVYVCSTGMIGQRLPMGAVTDGIAEAARRLSPDAGEEAALAIMTTDTLSKTATATSPSGWRIGAMAKGAGMLAPGLATMLVAITTDAVVERDVLKQALAQACRLTFDRTDSDGCMSTNDSVIALASGASGVDADHEEFSAALTGVCSTLARQLIGDAEGASHDVAITVQNATSDDAALAVARAISRSNLLKCAIAGDDPNWGRVISAAGTVPEDIAPFDASLIDVAINGVQVCRSAGLGEPRDAVDMSPREVEIVVDLHAGRNQATLWTNDLTHEYVSINGDYSS